MKGKLSDKGAPNKFVKNDLYIYIIYKESKKKRSNIYCFSELLIYLFSAVS